MWINKLPAFPSLLLCQRFWKSKNSISCVFMMFPNFADRIINNYEFAVCNSSNIQLYNDPKHRPSSLENILARFFSSRSMSMDCNIVHMFRSPSTGFFLGQIDMPTGIHRFIFQHYFFHWFLFKKVQETKDQKTCC